MYRVYTNSMPPQFRPHFLPDFLPWLAERLEKRNQRLGEFCFSSQFFVADQKLVGHRVFYSFYYLTISRWLFPFSKFLLCLWRVATEAPPFWIRVESWGEKCVRSRFSFQFLTRRSISTRQKKQKKHVGALQKNPVCSQTKKKKRKQWFSYHLFQKQYHNNQMTFILFLFFPFLLCMYVLCHPIKHFVTSLFNKSAFFKINLNQ